jgi:hypothetical protein
MRWLAIATITAYLILAPSVGARDWADELLELDKMLQEGERFTTPEFRLLWAREAWRCGNDQGAIYEWDALAEEGNDEAYYIVNLFVELMARANNGDAAAVYALQLFRPGDGTSAECKFE